MVSTLIGGAPVFVQILVSGLLILGTLLVWLELVLRAASVYIAAFFFPLALVAFIWPTTAGIAKRTIELLSALILSKFVIVAGLTLGLSAVSQASSTDDTVAGAAILLLSGFTPFALLRLAPVVETAAIGHLEGLSRRPIRAASRAATSAVAARNHPRSSFLSPGVAPPGFGHTRDQSRGPRSSGRARSSPQGLSEHKADLPVAGKDPGDG